MYLNHEYSEDVSMQWIEEELKELKRREQVEFLIELDRYDLVNVTDDDVPF